VVRVRVVGWWYRRVELGVVLVDRWCREEKRLCDSISMVLELRIRVNGIGEHGKLLYSPV
jgi:hypothetical protein